MAVPPACHTSPFRAVIRSLVLFHFFVCLCVFFLIFPLLAYREQCRTASAGRNLRRASLDLRTKCRDAQVEEKKTKTNTLTPAGLAVYTFVVILFWTIFLCTLVASCHFYYVCAAVTVCVSQPTLPLLIPSSHVVSTPDAFVAPFLQFRFRLLEPLEVCIYLPQRHTLSDHGV